MKQLKEKLKKMPDDQDIVLEVVGPKTIRGDETVKGGSKDIEVTATAYNTVCIRAYTW